MELTVIQPRTTTKYPKSIREASTTPTKSTGLRVLKDASSNKKLGGGQKMIVRGPFRGMKLYALTLVERMTCPSTCGHWDTCYGNNMPFAHRHFPGKALESALEADLAYLQGKSPGGFVVRLHVLGDFYSVGYVDFWNRMLDMFPALRIFGYTHREPGTPIGDAVAIMAIGSGGRVSILRSDQKDPNDPLPGALSVRDGVPHEGVVICPEQTGKTASCLTCGLCMNGKTSVQFLTH